jgi:hypothetical protein
MAAQLEFELFEGGGDAVPAPELRRDIPAGGARLLAALVRQGATNTDGLTELVLDLAEAAEASSAHKARQCRCDHPVPIRDEWDCRCLLCGKAAS